MMAGTSPTARSLRAAPLPAVSRNFAGRVAVAMSGILLDRTSCATWVPGHSPARRRNQLPSVLGTLSSVFGLRSSVFGLRSSVFGLRSSVFGLRSSVFGLLSSVFGLRSSVFGLRSSVFGLRSSVFGLRSSVFRLLLEQRRHTLVGVRESNGLRQQFADARS